MAAMPPVHAEKCCHLVSKYEASVGVCAASASSWSI